MSDKVKDLEKEVIDLEKEVEDLEERVQDLEEELDNCGFSEDVYHLEQEVEDLEKRDVYPRREITLPELMKFEYLKENWDKISLEDLEKIVEC